TSPSMAVVRKMRLPQTTGDEWPRPGMGVFHRMFDVSQVTGNAVSLDTPVPRGPRHPGQFSEISGGSPFTPPGWVARGCPMPHSAPSRASGATRTRTSGTRAERCIAISLQFPAQSLDSSVTSRVVNVTTGPLRDRPSAVAAYRHDAILHGAVR